MLSSKLIARDLRGNEVGFNYVSYIYASYECLYIFLYGSVSNHTN